jgi:PAS domain S-box-containing protein
VPGGAYDGGPACGGTLVRDPELSDRLEGDDVTLEDAFLALRHERARHAEVAALGLLSLHGEADRTAVIQRALEALRELLPCEYVALAEVTEDELEVLAATDPLAVGRRLTREGSLSDLAVRTGAPVRTDELLTDPRLELDQIVRQEGLVAGWAIPMQVGDSTQVLGCVANEAWKDRAQSEAFLQAIANILVADAARRAAEAASRADERRFRMLAENVPDAVFHIRVYPSWRIEYLSPRFEELTGFSVEHFDEDPDAWRTVVLPEDLPQLERDLRFPTDEVIATAPYRLRRADADSTRWVETRVAPLRDGRGRLTALVGATRDITALQETEEALRRALEREQRATEELREVGELKNALLAAVSHELRTPLTAVVGFAELLQRHHPQLPPERRELLITSLARNARRLERLLGDLLDLDRLDRSVIEPVRRPTPIDEVVGRVVQRLDAVDRKINVEVPSVVASLDGPKVERILENLLVNAVKHTDPGASVWVRVEPSSDGITVVVEDDGPGVPDDLKATVFDAFVRGEGPHRSHSPGTGIGLSLVARFAALHGGEAWVVDREGGGASFRVSLPDGPAATDEGDLGRPIPGSG